VIAQSGVKTRAAPADTEGDNRRGGRIMVRWISTVRCRLLLPLLCGVLLLTLLAAPAAMALVGSGPITWSPTASTYGVSETPFVALPAPAPAGTGATSLMASDAAYGAGFWDATAQVYAMGFVNAIPMSPGLPSMLETELSGTPLSYGVPLKLVFAKDAGQRVDSVAILGRPDALVSVEPSDPAALTAATQFTVRATVTDPVASYSGNVGAAFGLIVDCSDAAARDFQGSLFVTDLHWLDIDPPTFSATGLAGLSAHGVNGVEATFDGIFPLSFLTAMGIADPTQVQGYVDIAAVTGLSSATFTVLGAGDGSLWPLGYWKYRLTNSAWSTHNILYGRLAAPSKAAGLSPKGTVATTRPTFKWKKLTTAKTYEVRVYKGSTLLLKKTGVTTLSWKASKALPRKVYLTWKVRGVNASGAGTYSAALKFKIS
jgi:hypothetical protein